MAEDFVSGGRGVQRISRPDSWVRSLSWGQGTDGQVGPTCANILPFSPLRQAVAQTMDSVFKELLGKTALRQGLGPGTNNSSSPGPRSPKPPGCGRLGKNKGFSRGPGAPASPSTSHPQGLDSPFKSH